jgi:hypothetical protein
MDRSFIVEAQMNVGSEFKAVVAVIFLNNEPEKSFLGDMGLANVKSIMEVKPLSKQPTEPTLYVFGANSNRVTVNRFDWQGKMISSTTVNGEPHLMVPPVEGPDADRLLYTPSAHIISGHVREGAVSKAVVGVMFIKPSPGKPLLKPDKKTLDRAGFVKIHSVDPVSCRAPVSSDTLYLYDRIPAPTSVKMMELDTDGSVRKVTTLPQEPRDAIPALAGSAADRFLYSGGLSKSDFPRSNFPSSIPPSGAFQQKRRC